MPETNIDFAAIDSIELDDHLVLLMKKSNRLHVLNPIASVIWQLKKTGLSNQEIANDISTASNIPLDLALQDIEVAIDQWTLHLATQQESEPTQKIKHSPQAAPPCQPTDINTVFSFSRCTVKINYDSQLIANKVLAILPHLETRPTENADIILNVISSADTYLILKDGQVLERSATESHAALMVFHHLVDLICKAEDWLVILHAAGVSWQGRGIIFPALGGSGKTTLTAALIKHDFDYINDDVIPLLRKTGELISLPTSLSIKSGSWPLLQSLYPELETLEAFGNQERRIKYLPPPPMNNQAQTYRAKHIILPDYRPGATAQLTPLPRASALQAIIEGESLLHRPLVKEDIAALIHWISPLTCHRLSYDKLDSAVTLLHKFCQENSLL